MAKAPMFFITLVLLVVAFAPPEAEAAVTCNTVRNDLSPCLNFVVYGGTTPPVNCCNGAKLLYSQASGNTADRRTICSCLKSAASSATPSIVRNAASVPAKCGISIPYQLSPSTDCAKIR